jgi:superfamily II RNA helicase
MNFKSYTLDPFQVKSIQALQNNHTVVVSAATGTGKTLIAEFIIDKYLAKGNKRIVYTAPIKALSNQKFRDFKAQYGEENIGILTGDVVINPRAPVLIMTTEIYRNMLLSQDPILEDIAYVIFDEIHFMNDPERGTVWEEAILFSPSKIRFLCLSATIPNAKEFAAWLKKLKDHQVETIICNKRVIPLYHFIYDVNYGLISRDKLRKIIFNKKRMRDKKRKSKNVQKASLSMLISKINDKLPAIVFSFSRKQCEEEATFLSKKHFFNYNQEKISKILKIFNESIPEEILNLPSTKKLHDLLPMGIGFHHAGLLPHQRLVVEYLFSHGYLKVLFATETFSVGINMPAKTVILNGFRKYDGLSFRLVKSKEYFQLAGRAGRRGIDTFGYVVSVLNNSERLTDYYDISEFDDEPIISQFSLSYNTILNMIDSYSDDEIDLILKKNFYAFRMMSTHHRQKRMKISFSKKCRILKMMKYITNDGKLTEKGLFAKKIYFNEILISELFATRLYRNLTDIELLQVIAGIIYERRVNDHFSFHGIFLKN